MTDKATYVFHHVTAFTFSFTEFPVKPQLMREDKTQTRTMSTLSWTLKHTNKKKICVKSEGVGVRLGGSRAVWSRQGQPVARHPEELPLCFCTATGCNLLLRDKTKLTWHFTGDLAALSDCTHSVWLARIQVAGVYKMD